jgi:hypothetical protein
MAVAFLVAGVRLGHHTWPLRLGLGLLILSAVGTWLLARAHRHAPPRAPAAGWRGVLGQLWSDRRPAVAAIALLCLAQHALLISEAYVMLHALGAGPTLATALVFEGVTKTVNSLGAIVPGRLGIAEAGSAAMARTLGIGASFGLALALMRRVRALLWSALGVGLVLPDLWRMSQSASGTSTPPARLESREHSPLWVPPGPEPGPLAVGWRR